MVCRQALTLTPSLTPSLTHPMLLALVKLLLQSLDLSLKAHIFSAAAGILLLHVCELAVQLTFLELELGEVLHEVMLVMLNVDQLHRQTQEHVGPVTNDNQHVQQTVMELDACNPKLEKP